MDDIERLLREEIREQKRNGYGIHNRASRTGRKGAMRTPVDYLKGEAKKEYMGNSEVKTMYIQPNGELIDKKEILAMNILSYEDFKKLDKVEKPEVLRGLLETYKIDDLVSVWNVKRQLIYDLSYRLGVTNKKSSKISKKDRKEEIQLSNKDKSLTPELKGDESKEAPVQPKFTLNLSGPFIGEQVIDKLFGLGKMINPSSKYSIEINITEWLE